MKLTSWQYLANLVRKEKCFKGLKRANKFIRYRIAQEINIKYVPEIKFKIDESIEKGMTLLQKIESFNDNIESQWLME